MPDISHHPKTSETILHYDVTAISGSPETMASVAWQNTCSLRAMKKETKG